MAARLVRFGLLLLLSFLIAAACVFGLNWLWAAIGGGEMSVHGWIALGIGMIGTCGLAWGLMTLAFLSSRHGYDDRVDTSRDPGERAD